MKPTYNKSEVMRRAWEIFTHCRKMYPTFSLALSRAWEVEKANLAKKIKDAEIAENTWVSVSRGDQSIGDIMNGMADSLINYYRTNTYNGD